MTATQGTGARRRPILPEVRKAMVSDDLSEVAHFYGLPEDARARFGAIYSWGRSVPAVAEDKNTGDRRSVPAGRRGGD